MNISVVIPVFNTEHYVAEAIESVLGQTSASDEIVVVDDGSTDRTPAVIEQFVPRIIVMRQEHAGPSTALNTGIARATCDYLAFNDADDIWVPGKLAWQCAVLSKERDVEAVLGGVRQFNSPDWTGGGIDQSGVEHGQPGACRQAMLIRRSAFDRVGLFDQTLQLADFIDWYSRALRLNLRIRMLSEVLVLRRIHANNTGRVHRDAQRDENLAVLKSMLDARRASGQGS